MKKDIGLQKRGFTLIELIVAMGLFLVITSIALGGFARALRTQRQASAFISVNSNLSLVMEQIAREIRTGANFCVNGTTCTSPSMLSFLSAKGDIVTYCLNDGAIERLTGGGACGTGKKITASNISVQYLRFILSGNQNTDGFPPRVTILIGALPRDASAQVSTINFQTTVSSRVLDG